MTQYFYEKCGKSHYAIYASRFGANKEIVATASTKRGALAVIKRLNNAALNTGRNE